MLFRRALGSPHGSRGPKECGSESARGLVRYLQPEPALAPQDSGLGLRKQYKTYNKHKTQALGSASALVPPPRRGSAARAASDAGVPGPAGPSRRAPRPRVRASVRLSVRAPVRLPPKSEIAGSEIAFKSCFHIEIPLRELFKIVGLQPVPRDGVAVRYRSSFTLVISSIEQEIP